MLGQSQVVRRLNAVILGRLEARSFRLLFATRLVLTVALLAAAAFKAYSLATSTGTDSLLSSRWMVGVVIGWEAVLGIALGRGVFAAGTHVAAMLWFTVLFGVSLFRWLAGDVSCGCFGSVEVPPLWTTVFNAAAVLLLARTLPLAKRCETLGRHQAVQAFATLAMLSVLTAVWLASYKGPTTTLASAEDEIGSTTNVSLQPETWLGKKLPILKFIDGDLPLKSGNWIIVLHSHGCPSCRKETPRWELFARVLAKERETPRVAFVEVPPFGSLSETILASLSGAVAYSRLDPLYQWSTPLPTALRLSEGVVTELTDLGKETARYAEV